MNNMIGHKVIVLDPDAFIECTITDVLEDYYYGIPFYTYACTAADGTTCWLTEDEGIIIL